MKKSVSDVLTEIKQAKTADAAQKIATDFFASADAEGVSRKQAKTFFDGIDKAFAELRAPNHYEHVLNAAIAVNAKTSYHMQEFSVNARNDFERHQQHAQAIQPHLETRDAIFTNIAVINAAAPEMDFPMHYGATMDESPAPAYPEFVRAKDAHEFLSALKGTLKTQEITGSQIPTFFNAVVEACETFHVSDKDQINIMDLIQENRNPGNEANPTDPLFNMALDKAIELIDKDEESSWRQPSGNAMPGFQPA